MELHNTRTDLRIGIIGAGVSGLSAAHYLRLAGYERVTVLEREPRVGGKCCSVTVDGRVYEMGALMAHRDYAATLELMAAAGVEGGPLGPFHYYQPDGQTLELFPWYRVPRLVWQILVPYLWDTRVRFRHINDPGLSDLPPELSQPFAHFARQHGLDSLPRAFATPFTAFRLWLVRRDPHGLCDEVRRRAHDRGAALRRPTLRVARRGRVGLVAPRRAVRRAHSNDREPRAPGRTRCASRPTGATWSSMP